MEKDERLLPMPTAKEIQLSTHEYPSAYSPIYEEEGFNEQRSLREYFNVIYKRLPLILALAILVTSVVAFYMYRLPSQYEAQTQMIIEPPKPKQTSKDAININFGNDANYTNTQLRLLQNPDLMREVVVRLGLHRDPNLFANQNKGVLTTLKSLFSSDKGKVEKESSLPVLTESSESSTTTSEKIVLTPEESERAINYAGTFLGGLKVTPEDRTNLVNISIQSTNPEMAAKVADMTAKMFIENDAERATSGAKQQYEELSKSIDDLRKTIAEQEMGYIREMQNSNIPLREREGADFNAERLSTISTNLLTAEDDRRKIQAQYEAAVKASDGKGGILSVVPENKPINAAREQLLKRQADLEKRVEDIDQKIKEAQEKRQTLLVRYMEEHRDVQAATAQIEELEKQKINLQKDVTQKIDEEGTKLIKNAEREVVGGLHAQLLAAQRREAELRNDYEKERSLANFSDIAETKLTTLKREIETNRGLLDTYTQRQKEQQLAIESGRPENLKIVTAAVKPTEPIGPQRNRNIIVAFLVSLAAGIGLAFLLDYLDDSIRTSDDVGRHLGLPTLALIPHQAATDKRKLLTAKNGNGIGSPSTALIALEDTRSAMAEAYRHLRTSLLFSSAGKPPQTILVTSSQPSEGKTTTAINTAITLAQSGAEVVIIDCDLRRPRLHNHFELDNTAGLTNYLSGEKNMDLFMKPCPGLPKLKIVTSGPIPPNPAELLSSNEMKNLLQFLKGNFKHVIIDSPPAISFTDAAILSTLVDGVVLVAMAGKSSIHLMRRFKQRLANIGARIYGVVLNGIKSDSVEYGYYGYGYTYNYYTASEDDSTPRLEEVETVSSIHKTKG